MIPKVIHYCWFGNNPKPELAKKCIKSWEKYCPDYEIIEWNESNFDINSNDYVKEAYEMKKWAFVTDYVRLYVMYNYGGIYMDTDVEVVKNLDCFLNNIAFSGFEDDKNIPTGIMACEKKFSLFKDLLDFYLDYHFIDEDGNMNLTTNVTTITKLLKNQGFVPNGRYQVVNGFTLYPKEYFCPLDFHTRKISKTKNTYTIHWFNASWYSKEEKEKYQKKLKNIQKDKIIHLPNRMLLNILGPEYYEKFKKLFRK